MNTFESLLDIEVPPITERTSATFLANDEWCAKKGQTEVEFVWLWCRAKENYGSLTAHNFDHATDLLWYANHLVDLYEARFPMRPRVNRKILNAGILFHDSKELESDSAANFREYAEELGYTEAETMQVEDVIRSSAADVEAETVEQMIMNIADIHTVGEQRSIYKNRGVFYLLEKKQKLGKAFQELEYKYDNTRRLSKFVMKNLGLYGLATDWLENARENVRQDIREIARQQHRGLKKVVSQIGGRALQLFSDSETDA